MLGNTEMGPAGGKMSSVLDMWSLWYHWDVWWEAGFLAKLDIWFQSSKERSKEELSRC